MKFIHRVFLAVIILNSFSHNVFAQKIVCRTKISLEKMPLENQQKLAFLQEELDSYINTFDWTEDEFGYDVNCLLEIAFDEVKTVSYEDRYVATVIISNGVDLQYADKRWTFALNQGERLSHSSSFHPFTSLIDFYLDLILGHEFDKLHDLGGDEFYAAAKLLGESAKFSSQYYRGWDRRNITVTDLTSQSNIPYRKLLFHYNTGLYFFDTQEFDSARPHLHRAAGLLKRVEKKKLERFYDLNYLYFSRALKSMKMPAELKTLDSYKPQ
ncbi:MAG: DUF4835 family protein [FCB group bacterium]|nr:DUF4835 family protein [FCB group bacterium]